nr:hypothetical protein [Anaerolineae bacterium]
MLADYARGSIIRGGAADWEAYDASTDGAALYGDGTDILSSTTPTWKGTHTWTPGDDQGIILEMDAAQTADILQIKDSGGDVTSGFDERGIPFADGDSDPSNFFAGADAGRGAATGTDIVAVGNQAGDAVTSGSYLVLVGSQAGTRIQDADAVTAVGYGAAEDLTSGGYNTAIGIYALSENQTGTENVAVGDYAMVGVLVGNSNANYCTAVGSTSLNSAQTGAEYDVAIGYYAGYNLSTADRCIFLGAYAGYRQTATD